MASSLGPMPTAQKMARGCFGIFCKTTGVLLAILAVISAALWVAIYDSNRHHIIGKAPIGPVGEMQVAYQHDGDMSYNHYVRIVGKTTAYAEWTYVGWDLQASGKCKSASSSDGRFTCLYSRHPLRPRGQLLMEDTMPLMVIHDRKTGVIWPTEQSDEHFTSYWLSAWRIIRLSNPELPEVPE